MNNNSNNETHSNDTCIIYCLHNNINTKVYIGQTWMSCEERITAGYSNSPYINNAILKHGKTNFFYDILLICKDQGTADLMEKFFIIMCDATNPKVGYNIKDGGSHGLHSEISKAKISETMSNKIWSEEALEGKREGGRKSKGKKKAPHTDEWKEAQSIRSTEWHLNNVHPMLGKTHSPEAIEKISESSKGRKRSPESIKQGSDKLKMPIEREMAIIQAYKDGMIISDIEEKFETSRGSIYRLLKRNDISSSRENLSKNQKP